jgi:hypothetical protein
MISTIFLRSLGLGLLFLGFSQPGFSESLKKEGFVKNVGSAGQTVANLGDGLDLCPADKGEIAKKLSGYMISVEGTKNEQKKCIEVSKIEVLKSSRGEPVLQGTLKKSDANWVLQAEDGKSYTFLKIPKGMRALENKKLLVDAAQTSGLQTWKVVSYMINPISE